MESGGTVLSTNWRDVGKRKVEMTPPDDVEFKKYWAPPSDLSLFLLSVWHNLSSRLSIRTPTIPRRCGLHFLLYPTLQLCCSVLTKCRERRCSHFHSTKPTHGLLFAIPYCQMGSVNLNNLLNGLSWVVIFKGPWTQKGLKCDWQTWKASIYLWDQGLYHHSSFLLCSSWFSLNAHSLSLWEPFMTPYYQHLYKNVKLLRIRTDWDV